MLYISKITEYGRYFVTDTDDGVETSIPMGKLVEIVCKLKISIAGVKTRIDAKGNVHIASVDVYNVKAPRRVSSPDCMVPYKIVDRVSLNHFPNAKETCEKARGYENNDWTIIVNGVHMNSGQLIKKVKHDLNVGSSLAIRYYDCVMEYEDAVNNTFYVSLGNVRVEDMY